VTLRNINLADLGEPRVYNLSMSSKVSGANAAGQTSGAPKEESSLGASDQAKTRTRNVRVGMAAAVLVVIVVAVVVVLLLVFLKGPSPLVGTYVTADGRRLELRGNGTARYGVTYQSLWMKATFRWSASGKALKMTLTGVQQSQPGYKIDSDRLVGNGGVWVKQ